MLKYTNEGFLIRSLALRNMGMQGILVSGYDRYKAGLIPAKNGIAAV